MERKIEEQLLAWKNKTDDRLPLIVNGARQVEVTINGTSVNPLSYLS